jgi:radical SAM protein with 4Fe4S-binding SPASM domain
MNRITQCLHGRGTVSELMRHRHRPPGQVPSRLLAFANLPVPVVFWNLTNRCNLRCAHCYSRSDPRCATHDELTTTEARACIDDLASIRVPLILFTGGEPLLRGDVWELAEHAASKGIKTALSSNGTLITAEIARKIRRSGIEYVGISLDGARGETHDRFRSSPGSFSRAVAAFAHCRAAGVRCGVRVTLTRDNYRELGPLIDLAGSLGASRFCLYWLVPCGRGRDAYERLQLGGTEVTGALDLLCRVAQETDPATMEFLTVDAPQDCIHLLQMMERNGSPDLPDTRDLLRSLKGGCSAGTRVANIDPRGDVYPCQFARSADFFIGNIRTRPFSAIWADNAHPVIARFRTKTPSPGGKCGECRYLPLCGGGCRVRAHAATGDFFAEDPFCFVENTGAMPPQEPR